MAMNCGDVRSSMKLAQMMEDVVHVTESGSNGEQKREIVGEEGEEESWRRSRSSVSGEDADDEREEERAEDMDVAKQKMSSKRRAGRVVKLRRLMHSSLSDENYKSTAKNVHSMHQISGSNSSDLRRSIYSCIMSTTDFEESTDKLLKLDLVPGDEMAITLTILECCSQARFYLPYFGLLAEAFCRRNTIYQHNFHKCFAKLYPSIRRLQIDESLNLAKMFAHLLGANVLSWDVLAYIRLTERHTTSSSLFFIRILFQELYEHIGSFKLNAKLTDPLLQGAFRGIFPKHNPKDTRFAAFFFSSIGLSDIADNLYEYLILEQQGYVGTQSGSSSGSESSHGSPCRDESSSSSSYGSESSDGCPKSEEYSSSGSESSASRQSSDETSGGDSENHTESGSESERESGGDSEDRTESGGSESERELGDRYSKSKRRKVN